jgi:hypothetical protein
MVLLKAGVIGVHHHTQPVVEMESPELFAWAALESDPPDLSHPSN